MKTWIAAFLLALLALGVYWPHRDAQFVLDDYYTVVRNPLIKNSSLYRNIWTSRLFDASTSSGYIKFGYWRPVLESSWILDYRLFGLKACGYQWVNLLIHAFNCFLVYILWRGLFGSASLGLKAALLFCALPTQEWVVRYVTGRGDELSALFALVSLIALTRAIRSGMKRWAFPAFICLGLAALTREVAISYLLYGLLIYFYAKGEVKSINRFCGWWVLIGTLPFLLIWSIVPKQGNILIWHVFYFASAGFCLWLAQGRLRWVIIGIAFFASVSFYQGRFWSTEETLLRHTRSLEWWPRTVVARQLLMKYDEDIPAVKGMISRSRDHLIKAMWLRRLGTIYFFHHDNALARQAFLQALSVAPFDIDSLDALAVIAHDEGQEDRSLKYLDRALTIDPSYPDTLRTLGIHYYLCKDFSRARFFLKTSLFYDPDNAQARDLLRALPTL
ncbi:MAG: tetratricopeptide repeat protein [Candidatus Omnitrophica bacterium]|nr:tetratricopeptide repeat protein [Candidatus Omnitrophota bacterium]MDE2214527.1 tetratricopeptide repeat protein [Candidatus Omnitrophota bacterium]